MANGASLSMVKGNAIVRVIKLAKPSQEMESFFLAKSKTHMV